MLPCFSSNTICVRNQWAHSLETQSPNLICIDLDLGQSTLYSCVCLKKNSIIAYGK